MCLDVELLIYQDRFTVLSQYENSYFLSILKKSQSINILNNACTPVFIACWKDARIHILSSRFLYLSYIFSPLFVFMFHSEKIIQIYLVYQFSSA